MKALALAVLLLVTGVGLYGFLANLSPVSSQVPHDERSTLQQDFVTVVSFWINNYRRANGIARVGMRDQRRQGICGVLSEGRNSGGAWLGRISEMDATWGNDKAELAIQITPAITLKTYNNILSDSRWGTLIPKGSGLFQALAGMKIGDSVWFNGTFFGSDKDCIEEIRFSEEGGMTEPEFLFRFDWVRPYADGPKPRAVEMTKQQTVTDDGVPAFLLDPVPEFAPPTGQRRAFNNETVEKPRRER